MPGTGLMIHRKKPHGFYDIEAWHEQSQHSFQRIAALVQRTSHGQMATLESHTPRNLHFSYSESKNETMQFWHFYAVENHPQEMIEVDCIDISDIINKYSDEDYIVVKIDVEGAEYEIVRKMIRDGTIDKVNELFVEWHSRYGVVGETSETENQLKKEIQKYKVKLHDWY
jgi:FkbM family methyltransferase